MVAVNVVYELQALYELSGYRFLMNEKFENFWDCYMFINRPENLDCLSSVGYSSGHGFPTLVAEIIDMASRILVAAHDTLFGGLFSRFHCHWHGFRDGSPTKTDTGNVPETRDRLVFLMFGYECPYFGGEI